MLKNYSGLQQPTKKNMAAKTTRLYIAITCLFSILAYNPTIIAQNPQKNDNKSEIEFNVAAFCSPILNSSLQTHEQQQQTEIKSDKPSNKWQKFRTMWKRWYKIRQLLYSCDLGIQFLTGGDITPLDNARKKCLGNPSDAPFMSIRLCAGILDAALAGKPTEELVRDDVIGLSTYLVCLHAYNQTVDHIKKQIPGVPLITQLTTGVINTLIYPFLPPNQSLDLKLPYKIAGFALKHKLVGNVSSIVSKPVGYIAYKSIQQYKKYKARKNNRQIAQQKTNNVQELSNNTTVPVVPIAT